MILFKVDKTFDFKGRRVGTPILKEGHHKRVYLYGGSGCRHYKDCFTCPFKDCIDER